MLVKVRLASLWPLATAQQAEQQATSSVVKETTHKIATEYADLDQKTRDVADKLGVLLPSTPNAQQIAK